MSSGSTGGWRLIRVGLPVTAALVIALSTGQPASAHSITGKEWTSVNTICASSGCVSQGNLVGVWQSILWADGYLAKCGSSGIDGYFGSITSTATKSWQKARSLVSDGIVGPITWKAARAKLRFKGYSTRPGPGSTVGGTSHAHGGGGIAAPAEYWDYPGSKFTVHFQFSSPVWAFRAPANPNPLPYFATSHPSIFFTRC